MMDKQAPKVKILPISGGGIYRRTTGGKMKWVELECGHASDTNAAERRQGWVYCFDCFYGKPKAN